MLVMDQSSRSITATEGMQQTTRTLSSEKTLSVAGEIKRKKKSFFVSRGTRERVALLPLCHLKAARSHGKARI